ncbi:ATP synthase regulation protein NCA2 [Nitzschia inconspicua]|uniref:ATP synthase regulation protein NCA2 n=1 Tax=Nitzschia inconspicua TaxID=303405 RepID=A0A9K3PWB4_9STRA|nr:ATP synthase regulation protein NCA2 [Nitzschia inconspicua]
MPSFDASPSSIPVPTIPHPSSIANLADLENFPARIWEKYSLQFQSSFFKEILVSYPNQVVRFLWYNVILYKPPVGIVAAYTLTKLVTNGRLFQLQNFHLDGFTRGGLGGDKNNPNDPNTHDETSERALNEASKSRLDRHNCRALDLDRDDMVYKRFGGIERDQKEEEKSPTTPHEIEDATITSLLDALDETLKVTFAPGGSHTEHVQEMIPFMARAEQCALELGILPPNGSGNSAKSMDSDMEKLLRMSLQTAEFHILDSTLRLARDRLLRTSFRLSRTVKFWKRRLRSNNGALGSYGAICDETLETFSEIFVTRFWTPFKDLLDELMHRETDKLMTGVSLNDEATSLDFMLRDLGYGDGTPATRHEAMLKASRQYESDMNSGLILHALGGRLVRLMLIQVQQLKVGMLDAAETIDVLFQANRFNLQLLAIFPAIVIVVVGSKFLSRFLFTVRAKDLRPMSSVHAEMTEYLNELESILLLTNRTVAQDRLVPAIQVMSEREVAEFALTLYDYLVLLDYSSPQPFPDWQCDAIHASVTEFLGQEGSMQRLTMEDQIRLVDLLKRKNSELSKYL